MVQLSPPQRISDTSLTSQFLFIAAALTGSSVSSHLHGLPSGTSLRRCSFPSGPLGASPAFQVEVCSNSGHIQQFRVEAISLRAGRVSLYSLDGPHSHLSAYLFAYQGIPDPASCRAGLQQGGSVPESTSSSSLSL